MGSKCNVVYPIGQVINAVDQTLRFLNGQKAAKLAVYEETTINVKNHQKVATVLVDKALDGIRYKISLITDDNEGNSLGSYFWALL